MELEKEFKALISQDQYKKVFSIYTWNEVFTQINFYYIDDSQLFLSEGITVRVRGVKSKLKLQVKIEEISSNAARVNKEYEKKMISVPYTIEGKDLKELCDNFNFPNVSLKGFLISERAVYFTNIGVTLFLDKNTYLDTVDYEVEIEYEGNLDEQKQCFINELGLNFIKDTPGKYHRFFEVYNKSL